MLQLKTAEANHPGTTIIYFDNPAFAGKDKIARW